MKKLHSFAFYALAAPALTLFSGAALADGGPASGGMDREQQSTQYEEGSEQSTPLSAKSGESNSNRSGMGDNGYMSFAPPNGMHANKLIGSDVSTTGDEEVGPVNDLVIGEDGQVVAIVVGVGGFLGLGEKNVALGWDEVTKTSNSGEVELRIDQTREDLTSAPDFESQE